MRTLLRNKAALVPIFLWSVVGLLLLIIGGALAQNPWEVSTVLLIFFVFVSLLNKRVEYAITLLILFSIGVFGIYRGLSMPHITLPFGRFYISDILLLALAAHAFWRKFSQRRAVRYKKSGIVWAVSFLFGAIVFEVLGDGQRNFG